MPFYEVMFVCPPDIGEEELDQLIKKFEKFVVDGKGEVVSCDKLGRRRLAYEIKGHKEGFICCLQLSCPSNLIPQLDYNYRVADKVIRHMIIRQEKKKSSEEKAIAAEAKGGEKPLEGFPE